MIVLDASAVVDVVVESPRTPAIRSLLTEHRAVAPGHQLAEVLSAIARLVRATVIDLAGGRTAVALAADLSQSFVEIDAAMLRRSLELQGRIRVTDGLYVALAERLGCPVVTTDVRFANSSSPCEVIIPPPA